MILKDIKNLAKVNEKIHIQLAANYVKTNLVAFSLWTGRYWSSTKLLLT